MKRNQQNKTTKFIHSYKRTTDKQIQGVFYIFFA